MNTNCANCEWSTQDSCISPKGCHYLTYVGIDDLISEGTWIDASVAVPKLPHRNEWERFGDDNEPFFSESDIVIAKAYGAFHSPVCFAYYRVYDDGTDGWSEVCGDACIDVVEWMPTDKRASIGLRDLLAIIEPCHRIKLCGFDKPVHGIFSSKRDIPDEYLDATVCLVEPYDDGLEILIEGGD